jgi:hypothetical protein
MVCFVCQTIELPYPFSDFGSNNLHSGSTAEHLYALDMHIKGDTWRGSWVMEVENGSAPHLTCFLSSSFAIEDDCIAVKEIVAIMSLTKARLKHNHCLSAAEQSNCN